MKNHKPEDAFYFCLKILTLFGAWPYEVKHSFLRFNIYSENENLFKILSADFFLLFSLFCFPLQFCLLFLFFYFYSLKIKVFLKLNILQCSKYNIINIFKHFPDLFTTFMAILFKYFTSRYYCHR